MWGNRSKSHIGSYEIINLKILKHYNQPRIVSTQMKLRQKIDYFTVFESFSSTSCCSYTKKIENLASWTYKVVSGMLTLGGWREMEWWQRLEYKMVVGHK